MAPPRLLLPLGLALVGCGGLPVPGADDGPAVGTITEVSPYVVAPGAAAVARVTGRSYGSGASYALAVREGAAGGVLSASADPSPAYGLAETYTAPAAPGTYHVVGTVTEKNGRVHTDTAVVTVTAGAAQ